MHSYEPFYFTHQGATWSGPDTKVTGIIFPGPPRTPLVPDPKLKVNKWVLDWVERYNTEPTATNPSGPSTIQAAVDKAREWSEYYGRPIHIGEFGCFTTADPASRQLLPDVPRGRREGRDRLGDLGLEGRLPLLGREGRPARAGHAPRRSSGGPRRGRAGESLLDNRARRGRINIAVVVEY